MPAWGRRWGAARIRPPLTLDSHPRRRDPRWRAVIGSPEQGDALNALISDEYNMTSRRADPKAAPSVRDPVAPVVDDLPQGLADTVADLIGKPRARGWIHLCSAVTATVGGLALVSVAGITSSQKAVLATLIYTVTIVAMFSVSAIYHRKHWHSPVALKWMKRLDHSVIFVFIAGSYTPFALLAMPPRTGAEALAIMWTGAVAGVALKMWWPSAPRSASPAVCSTAGVGSSSACSSWAVSSTTSAPSSTAFGGRTRGRTHSATTSSFTPSPQLPR
jgi:channel protein (hemolysin III family)